MSSNSDEWLASGLLTSPAGVALLARLEAGQRTDVLPLCSPPDSEPDAVRRAVSEVGRLSMGQLLVAAVDAAHGLAGPWTIGAPVELTHAYRRAQERAPIAQAIGRRFGSALQRPVDRDAQQWWHSDTPRRPFDRVGFEDLGSVYGNGEFPWSGLFTVTDPPPECHDPLAWAWEVEPEPVSRWHLPVAAASRVWEIHRPEDFARLVSAYPKDAPRLHDGWELPGPNQPAAEVGPLAGLAPCAARLAVDRHVLPDWTAVSADFDGVHLSWAGFLTTEGFVSDLEDGGVTMLRYWSSERTLWLSDVFGDPAPMSSPAMTADSGGSRRADVRADEARRNQDGEVLRGLLGR